MLSPPDFCCEANQRIHGCIEENKPVERQWRAPTEERGGGGHGDESRAPEVIVGADDHTDTNPTARNDKPNECPNPNVPCHGYIPLIQLYPRSNLVRKLSAAGSRPTRTFAMTE